MRKITKLYVYLFYTLKSYTDIEDGACNEHYYLSRRIFMRLFFIPFELPYYLIIALINYWNNVNKSYSYQSIQKNNKLTKRQKELYKRTLYINK